jgi:hypothetical protein
MIHKSLQSCHSSSFSYRSTAYFRTIQGTVFAETPCPSSFTTTTENITEEADIQDGECKLDQPRAKKLSGAERDLVYWSQHGTTQDERSLAGRVADVLWAGSGATVNGVGQQFGGLGAHPNDIQELAILYEVPGRAQETLAALQRHQDVLRNYPTPREVLRTIQGNDQCQWAYAAGFGCDKPAAPGKPEWLVAQSSAFGRLVHHLDQLASEGDQKAWAAADMLTEPGGAFLVHTSLCRGSSKTDEQGWTRFQSTRCTCHDLARTKPT